MGNRLKFFLPLGLFVLLGLFLMRGLSLDPKEMPSALIDRPLPNFALDALGTSETVQREDVIGQVSLFNVWATWCISCRVEHPYLEKLARDENVPIYGVNYKDTDELAQQWLLDMGDPYVVIVADREGTLGLDLGVYGAPETYIVDAQGIIRYRHVGVIDDRVWSGTLLPIYNELLAAQGNP
ncbi:MAG: DsbE family thiol:disulfide interchange protein [Halioglobus sp.]